MAYPGNYYLPPTIAIPSALEITAITQAMPCVITVIANTDQMNTYQPGQLILMQVPRSYGMMQIAGKTLNIIAVSGNNISVGLDSSMFDAFIVPASTAEQPASIAPSGSRNVQYNNTTNIAFMSLNDVGN